MSCEAHQTDDGGLLILCGRWPRESRRRCTFCSNRATALCDGDRCTHPICDDHRWTARTEFDLCPVCETKMLAAAKVPIQVGLFG
jgi:hypothetical protein